MHVIRGALSTAAMIAILAVWSTVASANWSGAYTIAPPSGGFQQENFYNCGFGGTYFGTGWDSSGNLYVDWADATMPLFALPPGAALVGALLTGSVVEYDWYDGIASAGTYEIGSMAGNGEASNAGNNPGCRNIAQWGMDSTSLWLPGNPGQSAPFSIHAYGTALAYVNGAVPGFLGRPLGLLARSMSGHAVWLQVNGSMSFRYQWAYPPTGLTLRPVQSGDGRQVTVIWSPNGNTADVSYVLQRETVGSSGGHGFETIYSGSDTAFTTADQNCGYGYIYRVAAVGQDGTTPWTTTDEWDEAPCSVRISVPAGVTNFADISWPAVTPTATYAVVWCQSSSCVQYGWNVGGVTSARLSELAPNTEYTIWVCSTTASWGCPVASAWTYAAVPTLGPDNVVSGLSYDQQPLRWNPAGNPPGTVYDLEQGTFDPNGAWQGGTVVYSGTGTSFTAHQTVGGSYRYNVWAINTGYAAGTAPSNGVSTQVASTPSLTATGSTTATLSWRPVAYMASTWVRCEVVGSGRWTSEGTATDGATVFSFGGLTPNTDYYCATAAVSSNQGIQWWQGTNTAYTAANAPSPVGLTHVSQTAMTATWDVNGNPPDTRYYAVLQYRGGGDWLQESGWTTEASWTPAGLAPGTGYQVEVEAENDSGQASQWVYLGSADTVPAAPSQFTVEDGGLGWTPTSGRGYARLTWSPSAGATGYDVWIWDGVSYEKFDVGSATSWDSRVALVYPPDASLYPNVSEGGGSPPVFSHDAGGLNLRDRPLDLYCSVGSYYCSVNPSANYWFGISAYNVSGNSATFASGGYACNQPGECLTPTLPLQTDPNPPTITSWSINNGGTYTYADTVPFSLTASDGTSGVAAYALSDDGTAWTVTAIPGCAVGQSTPCQAVLAARGEWMLLPGPGSKTVWVKVESVAGVWSPPQTASVYVNVDQTVPTVDVALDGGASSTSSTAVTVGVAVTDPVADGVPALGWQARYSTDGGQTWSAWEAEGSRTAWSTTWTIPGGSSGERTVLTQVENTDNNLGQGGGTIYYAAPGGGTSKPGPGGGVPCQWPVNGMNVAATCVTSNEVTVPLAAPGGAVQMRISLNGATWGPWRSTASAVVVDLGSAPGAKTVWVEYQNGSGALTDAKPRFYVFDPAAPGLQASWAGDASATEPDGHAVLDVDASDDVGTPGMTLVVAENGAVLYRGGYQNTLNLAMAGNGYQMVQVTATDAAGNSTATQLGIYVQ